jgi:deazaflavin-dependent oxidoreductase (nitroreductase family)
MTGAELARHLGYPPTASVRSRGVRRVAATGPASWLLARSLRHLDAVAGALLRGRGSATEMLAGLPAVSLTTTGARSGRPRTVLVVPVVTAEVFAVLGTNFGASRTPAWAINLLAHPVATVEFRGRRVTVHAGELDDPVRNGVLAAAAELYPGFGRYVRRAAGRRVHVFGLTA